MMMPEKELGLKAMGVLLSTDVSAFLESIPRWVRVLGFMGVIAGAGWTAHGAFDTQAQLPARVDTLERRQGRIIDRMETADMERQDMAQNIRIIRCLVEADASDTNPRECIPGSGDG